MSKKDIKDGREPVILSNNKPINVDIPVCVSDLYECNVKNYKEVNLKSIEDRICAIEKSLDRLSNISRSK